MPANIDPLLIPLLRLHDYCASVSDELVQDYTGEAKDDLRAASAYIESSILPSTTREEIIRQLDSARSEIFGASRNVPACGTIVSRLRRQLANEIAARMEQPLPYNEDYYPRLILE
ncbi:hypothetical protein [Alcanivorax sp. 1008]|uniref:hypothetical protein n=1 Tax=Alcanivorax sp. 1008 TaxID=2816853 RepID=UPI001D52E155|nr:hypothetical protein [Alcanivorax sp. 1008]MCC1495954.1 hypothetical protein [Alcanivorax sp. 1008]